MSEKRIVVWVQHMADRPYLMLQWHEPDTGKRKSKSAETCNPLEAEQKRADLEYELNNGLHKQASAMSWATFRELFEAEHLPGIKPRTGENYRNTFELFERLAGPKALRSVSERTVSAFAAAMLREGGRSGGPMMASTVKARLQFLHTALAWAAKQKLIPACPHFPTVKVPRRKPQPVPTESFEKLIDKAGGDAELRALLLCCWLAGLRRNEAFALEREPSEAAPWVDFGRSRIVLPSGFVKAVEDQWVPLDPELRAALEALPRRDHRFFHFTAAQTGEPLSVQALSNRVTALARYAGVKLNLKALRRGFGCRYAGKVSAHVLQRLMRHSTISITMEYYANIDDAVESAILGPPESRNSSRNSVSSSDHFPSANPEEMQAKPA